MNRCAPLVLVALLACSPEPTDPAPVAVEQAFESAHPGAPVTYADPASRWRFATPPPLRVRATRFDPTTPAHKVKERFEISQDGHLVVRVDVWDNPEGLAPAAWIDAHAAYLRAGGATLQERKAGKEGRLAVVADQPRSCQAPNVVTAVFGVGTHMVAVTCTDGEDLAAREAFDTVLGSFAKGEGR
jgi:hypothetical protein